MSAGTCKYCLAMLWNRAICFSCGRAQHSAEDLCTALTTRRTQADKLWRAAILTRDVGRGAL